MNIGVSSSCFYPEAIEKSFIRLGELGVKTTEAFFNSPSELTKSFTNEINAICRHYGMKIVSFHPYMSFAEGFFVFSEYKRRFEDSLEMYKPMFEAAAQLGAKIYVLHGSKTPLAISDEEYCERYYRFLQTAKPFGITVAHENVNLYASSDPEFLLKIKKQLGSEFKAVLDVKQARRCGVDYEKYIDALSDSIIHLHLSSFSQKEDCLPPSEKGLFDFSKLFDKMLSLGYRGDAVVEVYRKNFKEDGELLSAMNYLRSLLK
ncbi:MAG: sugar phosphate isomerase/epimerase [Clostridia bacterium]|nr:sugar phosphate isomerase/epimerase [Clostridia bacterium]